MTVDLLLIHGAWQGAWAWDAFRPEIEARGYQAHAVDMPGNGNGPDNTSPLDVSMDLYMSFLRGELDRIGHPTIVIGHSSGGIIASQLAELEPDRVGGLIYLTAMMLPSGMRFAELVEQLTPRNPEVAGIVPYLNWSEDGETSAVRDGAAQEIFLQDCDAVDADAAAARLKPHPQRGRDICAVWTDENFGRVPRAYIEATQDRSVVPAAQRRMQELVPGAKRYSIDTGHTPQLARPVELADLVDRAVRDMGLQD